MKFYFNKPNIIVNKLLGRLSCHSPRKVLSRERARAEAVGYRTDIGNVPGASPQILDRTCVLTETSAPRP